MTNDGLKSGNHPQSSFLIRHSKRPLAAVSFSFILGIILSSICVEYRFGLLALSCSCLICAAALALHRKRISLSLVLVFWAISMTGLLTAIANRDGFGESDLRFLLPRNLFPLDEPVLFDACLASELEPRSQDSVTTVELHGFRQKDRWIACKGKGILRIAEPSRHNLKAQQAGLMWGDRIRGWAIWRVPHNFENPGSADMVGLFARRKIALIGRVKSLYLLEHITGDCSNPWIRLALTVRNLVKDSFEPIVHKEGGQPAAILASLVIGDHSTLSNTTREAFQNAGIYHALVVSGLHVAWITGVLLCFLKLLRAPERLRYSLAALMLLLYACVVGFQASITRCLWIFVLYLTGRIMVRKADSTNILFASALILLAIQPNWLYEVGFQLSFLSVLAITATAAPIITRYLHPFWEPLRNAGNPNRVFLQTGLWHRQGRKLRTQCEIFAEAISDPLPPLVFSVLLFLCRITAAIGLALGSMVAVSISVQLWIEPLLACYFNRISWISLLANLLIVPFSSIVLASGITASVAAHLPICGPALVRFSGFLASFLLDWTTRITMVPGTWQRCPTPRATWVFVGILLLFMWRFLEWKRFWMPCAYNIGLLACLSLGWAPPVGDLLGEFRHLARNPEEDLWKRNSSPLSFTFLDVGEGDSILIRFPDGHLWLLDAGGLQKGTSGQENPNALDIGEAVVSRYLWHQWMNRLDRVMISHTDLDHAGGMPAVMKNFEVGRLDYPPGGSDEIIDRISDIAQKKKAGTNLIFAGKEETVGEVTVRVLNPPSHPVRTSANDNSLVLAFKYKRFSALLTGDLEQDGLADVLSYRGELGSLLLKVAHHGSLSGTSNAFLERTRPLWAVISVGRNNPHGHPSQELLTRLLRHGALPVLTCDQGAVFFETDGIHYEMASHVCGVLDRGLLE